MLITPEATAVAAPRRILVAWNGTREAARAVSEAMPLLEAAETVTILCVGDAPELAEPPGAILAPTWTPTASRQRSTGSRIPAPTPPRPF